MAIEPHAARRVALSGGLPMSGRRAPASPAAEAASPRRADEAEPEVRLAALLERHGAGLRRVARTYAARTAETEDLLQEIALGLWKALPRFRGECSERTFVFRVAHNRGLSFAGRRRSEPEPLRGEESDAPTPEESVGAARRREALWRGIRALPPGGRAVLTMALEGLSHEEIADVLGITVNNVGVRLSRARAELRRAVGGEDEGR